MTELKLPEKMRVRLVTLYQAQQEAIARLPESNACAGALTMALEMFGLEVGQRHGINLETGIVTPAEIQKPTPIREEAPAEASG